MTALAAVVFFVLLRGLMAGYGGAWFMPPVATEAFNAGLPLAAIWIGRRALGRASAEATAAAAVVAEYLAITMFFGKGWVEPHGTLSGALGLGAGLSPALAGAGLMVGMAATRVVRTCSAATASAILWSFTGWMVLGPRIYAWADHIESGRRLGASMGIMAAAVSAATLLALAGRLLGEKVFHRCLWPAVAVLAAFFFVVPGPRQPAARPSVIVVVVDTLRADATGQTHGDGESLMPEFQRIAERGIKFDNAVSPAPWTLPAVVSILSGMNPHRHGVGHMRGEVPMPGDPAAGYLAGLLKGGGYQLGGFVNNPYLRPYYGLGGGYLEWRRYHGNAGDGVAVASSWISRHRRRPFFVLLHLMDPHWPYTAPGGYGPARGQCLDDCDDLVAMQYRPSSDASRLEVRRRYQAEVAFTDHALGDFYDRLGARGILDQAWLIITSDHGEEFWEHGSFLHGHTLYDELLRVPLLVVPPKTWAKGMRGVTVAEQVRLEDIAPTVVDIAGLEASHDFSTVDGASLLGLIEGEKEEGERVAVAGFIRTADNFNYAVRVRGHKLIVWAGKLFAQLFDLRADPGETSNVVREHRYFAAWMRKRPAALGLDTSPRGSPGGASPPRLERDMAGQLRGLGYLD